MGGYHWCINVISRVPSGVLASMDSLVICGLVENPELHHISIVVSTYLFRMVNHWAMRIEMREKLGYTMYTYIIEFLMCYLLGFVSKT